MRKFIFILIIGALFTACATIQDTHDFEGFANIDYDWTVDVDGINEASITVSWDKISINEPDGIFVLGVDYGLGFIPLDTISIIGKSGVDAFTGVQLRGATGVCIEYNVTDFNLQGLVNSTFQILQIDNLPLK